MFYVSALASLIRLGEFKQLAPRQVAAHKRDVLHTVQYLLGIAVSPQANDTGSTSASARRVHRKNARKRRSS